MKLFVAHHLEPALAREGGLKCNEVNKGREGTFSLVRITIQPERNS